MAFNESLTTDQYDRLRSGSYAGTVNVSFFSGRVVFAGQVTSDLITPSAWWQFGYNNVSVGSHTDVEDGMTIIIGTVNDLKFSALQERLFHGRIRVEATGSVVQTNISSAAVPVGAYFWVLDFQEILNRLSRPVGAPPSTVQFKDTTLPYEDMQPRVMGLRTGYAGEPASITGKFRLALSVTTFVEQVDETIVSYLYVFRDSIATVVSGSLSSPTVTVDIDPSLCPEWGETWGTLYVTQSDGVVISRKFGIKIHDADHLPNVSFENISVQAGWQQNYTATLPAFAGVDDILPGTPAILWRDHEFYGLTSGGLTDNNIEFIGWFVSETTDIKGDKDYSTVTSATFQLAGVGARLAYLIEQLLMIVNEASPSTWDRIWFANPRRSVWHVLTRHSTAGVLCDVNFDEDDLTEFYLFPAIPFKGTNILSVVNSLMTQVNGALEFAPDGRIFACRDAQFLSEDAFDNVPTIANWTAGVGAIADGFVVSHSISYDNTIGRLDYFGGTFNGSVQACKSRAPGMSQGESQGSASINDQILPAGNDIIAARREINRRSGIDFDIRNSIEELTVDHGDGYNFLIPSKAELYTWTIDDTVPGPHGIHRINFDTDTNWFVKSVSYQPGNDGSRKNRVVYRRLVKDSAPGRTPPSTPDLGNTIPPLTPIPFPSLPGLPPFPDIGLANLPPAFKPSKGKITHLDGNTVMVADDTGVWLTQTYIVLHSPLWLGIVPDDLGDFEIKAIAFDPLGPSSNSCSGYILGSDGTNSAIWYSPNLLASPPVWTKGDEFLGVFDQIRPSGTAGSGLVYSTGVSDPFTIDYDFTVNNQGWVLDTIGGFSPPTIGVYSSGAWRDTQASSATSDYDGCQIHKALGASKTLNSIKVVLDRALGGTPTTDVQLNISGSLSGSPVFSQVAVPGVAGTDVSQTWIGNADVDTIGVAMNNGQCLPAGCGTPGGSCAVYHVIIKGGTPNNATVRTFDDYGATIGSPIDVGSSPGAHGGFDLIRSGGVSYAAGAASLLKAATRGGSYSAFASSLGGNATSVAIPYFQVGSNTVRQTSSANPQVVFGLDAVVAGTCLYYCNGAGTPTAITQPVSGAIVDGPNKITLLRGTKMSVIVNVSGVEKLYETQNLAADGTATWHFVENVTANATIRSRRNDPLTGANKGQLFEFDDPCGYSSKWGSATEWDRISPSSGIISGDIYN